MNTLILLLLCGAIAFALTCVAIVLLVFTRLFVAFWRGINDD